jgi:hypothetical protein
MSGLGTGYTNGRDKSGNGFHHPSGIDPLPVGMIPANDHLEQQLLAALLNDNQRVADVGKLKPEHFGLAVHGRIFELIRYLVDDDLPAAPQTMSYMVKDDIALADRVDYLGSLARSSISYTSHAVTHYARELINLHYARLLAGISTDAPAILAGNVKQPSMTPRLEAMRSEYENIFRDWRQDVPAAEIEPVLSLADWLEQPIPEPDFLLGELISTTSRMMLIGPTGLGKTNVLMAMGMAISLGSSFLHWKGCGRARKVLFIDGEMSKRQLKKRLNDAIGRAGFFPDTFYVLSAEDANVPLLLDTAEGQQLIDHHIERLGGVDLIIFDNINCLFSRDDSFGADSWAAGQTWRLDLTRRGIGQIYAHHTGQDETHGYGTKTREWALDTVGIMEKLEDAALVAFSLKFAKARERGPDNFADFEDAKITLADDRWAYERGDDEGIVNRTRGRPSKLEDIALRALDDALASPLAAPHPHPKIQGKLCVTRDLWCRHFKQIYVGDADEKSVLRAFRMYANKLQAANRVGHLEGFVWVNK